MPFYEFKNLDTGEIEEHSMRIAELDQFKEDNPHLQRHLSGSPGLTTDGSVSVMRRAGSEWQDVLKKVKKGSGQKNSINV